MSGGELLLAVVPGEDTDNILRYARLSGRRIVATGENAPDRLAKTIRAAVFSPDSYFEQADLTAATPKLLPMVARRHVDAELVFDEAYRLRTRIREKRERIIATDIVAMPESDLKSAGMLLPLEERPCLQLVPLELALAALVRKVTAEPVIVFWEKGGYLLAMVVADGTVHARTRERVSAETRDVILARAENSLRTTAGHQLGERDVFLSLYTGDLFGVELPEERDKASLALEKKIAKTYRPRRDVPKDAVLRDPELYGLPDVDEDWSFLDRIYRDQVSAWRFAKPVAALAGLAGCALAAAGGYQHLQAMDKGTEFDKREARLRATLAEVERARPTEEAMASARDSLKVQEQVLNEVRLDRFLSWVTHAVPPGSSLRSILVEPAPPPQRVRNARAVAYKTGEKPFIVKLEIILREQDIDAAEAVSGSTVKRLSQRLQMLDSKLRVPPEDQRAEKKLVLHVDALARATSF